MKKLIALLLVLCTVFSLCACGSSSKKKTIDEITEDDLNAAADKLMERGEEEAPANSSKDLGPIEDYLVTVEITPENFNEYFEWTAVPELDEFGDEKVYWSVGGDEIRGYSYCIGITSKKYDEGLVIYDIEDCMVEYELLGEYKNPNGDIEMVTKHNKSEYILYMLHMFTYEVPRPITSSDQYEVKLGRCKGTVTFLKSEYIVETTKEEVYDTYGYPVFHYSYELADGSYFDKYICCGNEY